MTNLYYSGQGFETFQILQTILTLFGHIQDHFRQVSQFYVLGWEHQTF